MLSDVVESRKNYAEVTQQNMWTMYGPFPFHYFFSSSYIIY